MGDDKIKELLDLGFSVANLISGLKGSLGLSGALKALAVLEKAGPAIQDAKLALAQYVSMSDADAADLENYVQNQFGASPDNVEKVIEQVLTALIELHKVIQVFVKPQ